MRAVIAWPVCWALFWTGDIASKLTRVLDRDDEEPGWSFRAAFRTYQATMGWSFDVQKWAENGRGFNARQRLPWRPPQTEHSAGGSDG